MKRLAVSVMTGVPNGYKDGIQQLIGSGGFMQIDIASFGRAALFLGVPFVLLVFWAQWHWAKVCEKNIQLLIALRGGGGNYKLASKAGGVVTIENPETKEVRSWPINELSTIDVTYPGLGFLPKWMQKTIRLAILNEGDMEPLLNRSPHRKKVASPDVIAILKELNEKLPEGDASKTKLVELLSGVSSGPTREIVGDPLTLGTLRKNAVLQALATVSNDLVEALKDINKRLANFVTINPTVIYIGIGLVIILGAFTIFKVVQMDPSNDIDSIKQALGITTTTIPPVTPAQ